MTIKLYINIKNNNITPQYVNSPIMIPYNKTSQEDLILKSIENKLYFIDAAFAIYTLICIFWLVYVVTSIFIQIRNKRKLLQLMRYDFSHQYWNRLFMLKEITFRSFIFFLFLCFEVAYCLMINIYGFLKLFFEPEQIYIPIGPNCSLSSESYLGIAYDDRFVSIVLDILYSFTDYSFSMMVWLFGASLLHLSYAARNELRMKNVIIYILFGIILKFLFAIPEMNPSTSIFGTIAQSVMDQISFFVVLYIAKRKFFPAMNSRVIDAYHLHRQKIYLQQKKLLKLYKVLVGVFLITFELFIFKNLVFYNMFIVFESTCVNLCWFQVTYHLPNFVILETTNQFLCRTSSYFFIITHLIDLIVYTNFFLISLVFILFAVVRFIGKISRNRRVRYRYQVYSAWTEPLIHQAE